MPSGLDIWEANALSVAESSLSDFHIIKKIGGKVFNQAAAGAGYTQHGVCRCDI
jgi:hypothetical protein